MDGTGFLLIVLAIACIFYVIVNYDVDESYDDRYNSIKNKVALPHEAKLPIQSSYDLISRVDREFLRPHHAPDLYACSKCETEYHNKTLAHNCCRPRNVDNIQLIPYSEN